MARAVPRATAISNGGETVGGTRSYRTIRDEMMQKERDRPPRHIVGGVIDSWLCDGERFLDTELLHTRAEGVGMEAKPSGGTLLSFDNPIHILKNMEDVASFDLF